MSFLERWWPIPAAVAAVVLVQQLTYSRRYDVGGHAAEHVGSGSFLFFAIVVTGVLLWTTPEARRSPLVIIGLVGWLAAGVAILIGNVDVVDALIDSGQSHAGTDSFVMSPAIEDAHSLADNAPYLAVLASLVVTLGLYFAGVVSMRLAIIAAVLNVLFPPWILPGLGVVVITVIRCVRRERAARVPPAIVTA